MMKIFCLLLLSLASVHGQMNTRILRDVINPDMVSRDRLLAGLGAGALDEVPYVGSSTRYLPTQPDFLFILEEEGPASPHFLISAIEISSITEEGDCNLAIGAPSRITELTVEIGTATDMRTVNVSSYQTGEFLDLSILGLGPENEQIRFYIPPLSGDGVIFDTNNALPLCLQVEFIGGQGIPPPTTPRKLLQYNMRAPTFYYTQNVPYGDVTYNGIEGAKYTGGIGKLMDGRVGTDPEGFPDEWVGFTESAGLRIFFNKAYPISQIAVYVWSDLANGADTPTGEVRDKLGRIMEFQFSTEVYDSDLPMLQVYTGGVQDPIMLDFLELPLRTSGQSLLVTEVSVLQDTDNGLEDIATGQMNVEFVPVITTTTSSVSTMQPPPLMISETIIYAVVGIISCLLVTVGIMCFLFVVIFCFMWTRARKENVSTKTHPSLIRQLSDKYINPSNKPAYDQFQKPDETYSEIDNVYQEVERHVTLPLPPIPTEESKPNTHLNKEDSYIEMQATPETRQNPKTRQMSQMRTMRTFSEDDYVPVTPPHTSGPDRQISDLYVAVTPPEDDRCFNLTQVEEKSEAAVEYNMTNLSRNSLPNAYVTMETKDTPM